MVKRDELTKFIYQTVGDEWLNKAIKEDDQANGVQFVGSDKVDKLALGVSLNEDFLKEAVKAGAQYCLFHHGFDTRVWKSRFPTFAQKRLRVMVENNLTVMGMHYVLDAHPTLGNNAIIIRELGGKIQQPFYLDWGYTATLPKPTSVKELQVKCAKLFEHDILAVMSGPEMVKTIGVVSGKGTPGMEQIAEMEAKGVELYISGETSEWLIHQMKESEINYFCGGHYATEVFGVQELGKVVKKHFGDKLEVEFIDIPNPV
jgi:dinuclear metal center YbgI/SA1388 family protein